MIQIAFLIAFFNILISSTSHAAEIDYRLCKSIQESIARETEEIVNTSPAHYDELAQLYVSRGENYLLDGQYDHAVEDFQNARFLIKYCCDRDAAAVVAFRAAFGEVVSYDNLGMEEQTLQSLEQLKLIALHIGCSNDIKQNSCQEIDTTSINQPYFRKLNVTYINSKDINGRNQKPQERAQDNYDDILGPNQAADPDWCEEIVTGVGRAMDAIACLAPNNVVKIALIGIIETLIARGVKCCQAGGFWKACVAPIARKWKEWKNNKENNIFPNEKNLPFFD